MSVHRPYLEMDDSALLADCDVNVSRSSGPGGQHRNKVSTAIRLVHRPTGITARGHDRRSQQENKRVALSRLRMKLACELRRRPDLADLRIPAVVRECTFVPRGRRLQAEKRLEVGRRDRRFWPVAAFLLDLLDTHSGHISDAAASLGITSSNFTKLLQSERHLLAAAQGIRRQYGQKPLL